MMRERFEADTTPSFDDLPDKEKIRIFTKYPTDKEMRLYFNNPEDYEIKKAEFLELQASYGSGASGVRKALKDLEDSSHS